MVTKTPIYVVEKLIIMYKNLSKLYFLEIICRKFFSNVIISKSENRRNLDKPIPKYGIGAHPNLGVGSTHPQVSTCRC